MRRVLGRCILVAVLVLSPFVMVGSATTLLQGAVSGFELCPQSVCGAALFFGAFQGRVNGRFTTGLFAAAITHAGLPTPEEPSAIIGGRFVIHTWRGKFEGDVGPGILATADEIQFQVQAPLEFDNGGEADFTGILDHGPFPPTIVGLIQ